MKWEPAQYLKFQEERFAPFVDLMALVDVQPGMTVVDLGCGTGELTRKLADALPASTVLGIDSSPSMLERARAHERDGLRFEAGRIEDIAGQYDLVFSHAAIHWVDDHPALLGRFTECLKPGGQLAIQLPSNHTHAAQSTIRDIAGQEPFRTALNGWTREVPVLTIGDYAPILYELGIENMTVFEKVYPHVLADADAIAQWTRGTSLLPYLERLPDALQEPFFDQYIAVLRGLWPEKPVFYGFRRTVLYGRRSV